MRAAPQAFVEAIATLLCRSYPSLDICLWSRTSLRAIHALLQMMWSFSKDQTQRVRKRRSTIFGWDGGSGAQWLQSKRKDSGFPFGCADTATADGRRNNNVYEINPWLWQFGRGKPRLGGLRAPNADAVNLPLL
jgi:hypothetical protein